MGEEGEKRKLGRPRNKPNLKPFSARIEQKVLLKFGARCRRKKVAQARVIEELIREWLEKTRPVNERLARSAKVSERVDDLGDLSGYGEKT